MPVAELYWMWLRQHPLGEVKGVQKCEGCNTRVFMEILGRTLNL